MYPFWNQYFNEIGVELVLSPMTDPRIASQGVDMALAQPCYPVQIAHGHAKALIDAGVDYLIVPNMLDA
jgi:predicted nucleotide-binding protein (sugar kinase/HSP70/actin superfamily)